MWLLADNNNNNDNVLLMNAQHLNFIWYSHQAAHTNRHIKFQPPSHLMSSRKLVTEQATERTKNHK